MQFIDHLFVFLLLIAQPAYGYVESRRYAREAQAGRDLDRPRFYLQTGIMEWTFLAALIAAWMYYDRNAAALGLTAPAGAGFWTGALLVVGLTALLVFGLYTARRTTGSTRRRQVESLSAILKYLPQTRPELTSFYGLSITAGIVEELVYRGFLFWYLAHAMPVWLALLTSSAIFGFAHSYQGAGGALRCGLVGLAFGALYVLTGSIWLPILAHVLFDVLQGATVYELLQDDDTGIGGVPA